MAVNIKSKIPDILRAKGWGAEELYSRGITVNTAYRAKRGDVDFTLKTLVVLAEVLEVYSLDDLIELVKVDDAEAEESKAPSS